MMMKVFNEHYYFDINKVQEIVSLPENMTGDTEQSMSIVKFEIVKAMIDTIMTENIEIDEKLGGVGQTQLTIPFRLAFNTLLFHNIIREI